MGRGIAARAAVVIAVALISVTMSWALGPRSAQAVCLGDCDGSGDVAVNEIIVMVNIALGSATVSACAAADPGGTGGVTITQIIAAVSHALDGCPADREVCGNGRVEGMEECDNGGICMGGDNAGTACASEADCVGEGVCDAFGLPGGGLRKACRSDADCTGARCIRCKPFGGDGCAANCTDETEVDAPLAKGEVVGTGLTPGTSGTVVHSDIATIPLSLSGTHVFVIGKERNGRIPVVQKTSGVQLDRVQVMTIACACLRGVSVRTCGGTVLELDGATESTNCTTDDSICAGQKPCTPVDGPGNAAEGVVGCDSLPPVDFSIVQDSGGATRPPSPPIFTFLADAGQPGSILLSSGSSINAVVGGCTGTGPEYGPDGEFCTDDDPPGSAPIRFSDGSLQLLTSGTASIAITHSNGIEGNNIGPFVVTGAPASCSALARGSAAGVALVGGFTVLDRQPIGDIVATNVFVAQ
jgi:hypothetical protein